MRVRVRDAHRALGRVDLVQQGHDFFAEAESSGVAGRRRAARQAQQAAETQESRELHGSEAPRTVARTTGWMERSSGRGVGVGDRTDDDAFKGRRKTRLFWSSGSSTYQEVFFYSACSRLCRISP